MITKMNGCPVAIFGTGDILMVSLTKEDEPNRAYLLFSQAEPGEIGRTDPRFNGSWEMDFKEIPQNIIFRFDNIESIDAVIERLQRTKWMLTNPEEFFFKDNGDAPAMKRQGQRSHGD